MSITDLMKKYTLPKTTIWYYVRDIQLAKSHKQALLSRRSSGIKRMAKGWKLAEIEANNILSHLQPSSIWPILFTALYWSEGTKKGGFVFTNTDQNMVRVFVKILRTQFEISNKDFEVLVRVNSSMNLSICKTHWSKVTGVPESSIKIDQNDRQNKSKSLFGICRITVKKGGRYLKLTHCLIKGVTAKML